MELEVFEIAVKDFVEFEEHQDFALADVDLFDILPAWAKIRIAFLVGDEDFPAVASSDYFIQVIPFDRLFGRVSDFSDCVFLPLWLRAVAVTVSVTEQWLARNAKLERVTPIALKHEANFPFLVVLDAHRREEEHVPELDRAAVGMFFKGGPRHLQVSDTW